MLSLNARFLGRPTLRLSSKNILCNINGVRTFSDDDKPSKKTDEASTESKKDTAKRKLSQLLEMMVKDDVVNTKVKLDLAKPKKRSEPKLEKGTKSIVRESVENKIITAVKDVATTMGGDVKQTESELLSKLLNSTKPDHSSETSASLSEIVKGMIIDRSEKPEAVSRAQQVRQILGAVEQKGSWTPRTSAAPRQQRREREPLQIRENVPVVPIDIFGAEPLGIFTKEITADKSSTDSIAISPEQKTIWDILVERDLRLAVTHPPSNYYQQMIQWTDQGKLWKFPIDNEQGMDDEHNVYFTEHVFLEQHLEPWCPRRGPLRHFMELVCVGMSKNHYMSARTKRGHLDWYREYFGGKTQLLQEVGAMPTAAEGAAVDEAHAK